MFFLKSDFTSNIKNKAKNEPQKEKIKMYEKKVPEIIDWTSTFSNTRMLEGNMSVFYCLVLDKNANKYYNIEITYKTKEINGIGKDYPYFGNEEEL